jgi:hypothetical protein
MGGGCGRNSIWGAGWLEVETKCAVFLLLNKRRTNQGRTAEMIRMETAAMVGIRVCACIWWYDL